MKKRTIEFFAALLLVFCLTGLQTFAEEPREKVFRVASPEDLDRLAQCCRINTWSEGVTVELDADLDLSGESDPGSLAYFNGVFNGNGHKIAGYRSRRPLFGIVGPSGTVRDLSLSAEVESSGDDTAALVSENNGTLEGIRVEGKVSGKTTAGLLAAVNGDTGSIVSCATSGSVTGESSTGGVAGKNTGLISGCVNRSQVNTDVDDSRRSLEGLREVLQNILISRDLNSTENLTVRIDTGGIVGCSLSGGVVTGCVNEGVVGHPHDGVNVGGVCGRTGGAVEDCENRGAVRGRRNVGGIAGKQQPEITVDFSEDVLEAMDREMEGINALVTDTLDTAEGMTNVTYDRLSRISGTMKEVQDGTREIRDQVRRGTDEAADAVDDGSQGMSNAAADLRRSLSHVNRATKKIDDALALGGEALGLSEEERSRLQALNEQLKSDLNTTLPLVEEIRENGLPAVPEERRAALSRALAEADRLAGDARAMETLLKTLREARDRIADGSAQAEALARAGAAGDALDQALDSAEDLGSAASEIDSFGKDVARSASALEGELGTDRRRIRNIRSAGNDVYAGLDSVSGQLDGLNAGTRDDSLEVIGKLDEINGRFSRLLDLMEGERDRLDGLEKDDLLTDDSDGDSASRIVSCKNAGEVSGDERAGGIAGTVGVELDLDPDRDVLRSGNRTLNYAFGVSAVIRDCRNLGEITARENFAGGVLGKGDLGYLLNNVNEADVSSPDGSFVGGVAGYSAGTLEGNTARCRVTALRNAGGVCGYGTVLRNNTASVTVRDAEEYAGAVAGNTASLDPADLAGNLYRMGTLGAVNNVDYAGMAEKSPETVETVRVRFRVNGRPAGEEEVPAGTLLRDVPFPEAGEKEEGFCLRWDADPDTVLTEDLVVESTYSLPVESLASAEKQEGTERSLLIVDGSFREGDALIVRREGEDRYFISVPEDGETQRRVRVLKPGRGRYQVLVNGEPVPAETFGEYLVFATGEREAEILLKREAPLLLYVGLAAALLAAAAAAVLIRRRAGKKPKA